MPTPGPLELVIILVIALLILGPGRLPDVGASLGKSIREFRKASSDVQDAVKVDVDTGPLPTAPSSTEPAPPVSAPPSVVAAAPSGEPGSSPADTTDPSQNASGRSTNASDSPITAG